MVTRTKVIGVLAVVVIGAAAWWVSRPAAPRAAVHQPGQAVIDESEMSPAVFKERRRRLVEENRAGSTGAGK